VQGSAAKAAEAQVTCGIDTHAEVHVAAAVDQLGRLLGTCSVPSTPAGYAALLRWVRQFGTLGPFGIEGTGSYGAGLARWLRGRGYVVVEVERPKRQDRRRRGKSDAIDAEAAARAVQAGTATAQPKAGDGPIEMLRTLQAARRSALKARTQAANQLHALVVTAPDALRSPLRRLSRGRLVATAAAFRPPLPLTTPTAATQLALKSLAIRYQQLGAEIERLEAQLAVLVAQAAPDLVAVKGIGVDIAATLLATAGDNPDRLRHEGAFAHLCGVAPIPASSGKTQRHRLNRGGDREANRALYLLAIGRMGWDPATRAYVERRTAEGLSKPEIIRCLKRYIARQLYPLLTRTPALQPLMQEPTASPSPVELDGSLAEPSTVLSARGAAVTRRGGAQRSRPRSGLDRRVGTESPRLSTHTRLRPDRNQILPRSACHLYEHR
jgi:transposase